MTQVDRTDKWIDKFDSPPMIWINDEEQQMVWTILGPEKDFKGIAENDDVSVDNDASKHSTEEGVKVDIGEKTGADEENQTIVEKLMIRVEYFLAEEIMGTFENYKEVYCL